MVIIEFFDKVALENICGALLCRPERVILIGSDREKMERSIELYYSLLRSKGIRTQFSCVSVEKNHLQSIVDRLSEIVENCRDEFVFDLTGGDELYLVAVGIIMQRYGDRVKCHRFNFLDDRLCDCDADGEVLDVRSFDISVNDNITIYDGDLVTDTDSPCFTYPWVFNSDFISDIDAMWSICRKNPRLWNAQIGTLGAICDRFDMPSPLQVAFNQHTAQVALYEERIKYTCVSWILSELQKYGLINSLYIGDSVHFEFKNAQVKRCLTVAGQILELFVASRMLFMSDIDGSRLYNDVKVGAVIRWGQLDDCETPIINEIDIIAMKGAIPVFISCKNGYFDANELYKLNTVAERFGNKYAKKVLVATDIDKLGTRGEYLLARMEDMGIRCISDLDQMSDTNLESTLASLWKY